MHGHQNIKSASKILTYLHKAPIIIIIIIIIIKYKLTKLSPTTNLTL